MSVGAIVVVSVSALVVVAGGSGHHRSSPFVGGDLAVAAARTGPTSAGSTSAGSTGTGPRCADALVVGVNGNAEHPLPGEDYGKTVAGVVSRVVAKARAHDRRVAVRGLPLSTTAPRSVLRDRATPAWHTLDALSPSKVRQWRSAVATGARDARTLLSTASVACPDRPVLFVGLGQGAAVVHRVLTWAGTHGELPGLVGGVLISDPDRIRYSAAHPVVGDPAASRRRDGLFSAVLSRSADVPGRQGSYAVWSVCTSHDLVCDPTRATVRDSLAVARSYRDSALLRGVAQQAWRQLALWPVPAVRHQLVSAAVGESVHLQLAVAPGTRGNVTWTEAVGLPSGLALSPTGLLSGTPTTSGSFPVTYRTSNTDPVTTGHSGSLLVTVAPASVSLSAGGQTTCMTRSDGTASCWGRNDYGQVGDGTTTQRDSPVTVPGTGWTTISTGGASTCGIKARAGTTGPSGTLWCWGLDNYGQLGIGRGAPVHRPHQVGSGTNWATVSTGWAHTCATKTNGTLWCWGQNLWGQLGIGSVNRLHGRPQQVGTARDWRSVSTGGWHSCAVDDAGAAYCWGHNTFGEVGDGTLTTRSSPVEVTGGSAWLQLSTAWAQTCGITQTGQLLCWGFNRQGQLGDGTLTNHARPTAVAGGQAWTQVTTGDGSTCATAEDQRLWCWGDDRYGQLGDAGSNTPEPTPTQVAALPGAVQLTSSGWLHTCAIPSGGPYVCWGNDEAGQLGDGDAQTVTTLSRAPSSSVRSSSAPASSARAGSPDRRGRLPEQPRHQVSLRRADLPSDTYLDHATAAQVASAGLASRPPVTSADRAPIAPFTIMTMNMLGSQHTAPGGDEPSMAPGRIRAEWASTYVHMRHASLVGMQEPQPDQIVALDSATRGRFEFYPGNSIGYDGAPQSVMWQRADWKMTWHSSISIPFTSGWRPQPVVRLQQRDTGAELYWINVHFSARRANQADRDKAMKILLKAIGELKGDRLPIMLTGDFNEIAPAFCTITGRTPLEAATGGSNDGGRCILPKGARIDWIFGSRGSFSQALMDHSAQVRRTTDHHVLSATFATGG
jgi:alpha-tubulin suppressor-like RCC1 family protein/endonuclease/exonuclease/phosphatase family metal-dependent hydrolase